MERSRSIDTARGLAVILMITYHILVWLVRTSDRALFFRTIQVMATYFAPAMFFILTGVTLSFSYLSRRAKGQPVKEITIHVLKRYGGLIAIGIVLNIIVWGPGSFWLWDVLEMIGLCNIIAYFLLLIPADWGLLAGGAAGLSLYVLLMNISIPHSVAVVIENPLMGTFPLGPFLFFTIVGVISGKRMLQIMQHETGSSVCKECFTGGAVLVLVSIAAHLLGLSIDRYPVTISYVAFASGITILVVGVLFWWQDIKKYPVPAGRFITIYGRNALNIYIAHYLIYRVYRFADIGRRFHLWPSVAITVIILLIIPAIIVYIKPEAPRPIEGKT
jgi:uncharacterized membrane protein